MVGVEVEELFRAVNGEGVRKLPGGGDEHADGGDGAAEVDVKVVKTALLHPAADEESFREVEEPEAALFEGEARELGDGGEAAEEDAWVGEDGGQDVEERGERAAILNVGGGAGFGGFVGGEFVEGAVGPIDGDGFNVHAAGAQAEDFLEEEGMGDGGVPAEQIGDAKDAGRGFGRCLGCMGGRPYGGVVERLQGFSSIRRGSERGTLLAGVAVTLRDYYWDNRMEVT